MTGGFFAVTLDEETARLGRRALQERGRSHGVAIVRTWGAAVLRPLRSDSYPTVTNGCPCNAGAPSSSTSYAQASYRRSPRASLSYNPSRFFPLGICRDHSIACATRSTIHC